MERITVKGVPGCYYRVQRGAFQHINYIAYAGAPVEFVASISVGQTGEGGLRPCGNPDALTDIDAAIRKHADKLLNK
jgi:hypothetical protein